MRETSDVTAGAGGECRARLRVGLDLVEVEEVRESLASHGERYLARVYTPGEIEECGGRPGELAARFAAKEATLKVLRGPADAIPWTTIAVARSADGAPRLELSGAAAGAAAREQLRALAVSVAADRRRAIALVTAQEQG